MVKPNDRLGLDDGDALHRQAPVQWQVWFLMYFFVYL
jgi:hypothetical protein